MAIKLILGLGNPESRYDQTRHNIGFMLLDHIAKQLGGQWQEKTKFKALVAEATVGADKILLAKPTTYYNHSGEAAKALVDFYKLAPEDLLVIHDELALPFGTVRTRLGGRDAGNNGIKHLNALLGPHYARIRVGIANQHLPHYDDADFVLSRFTSEEITQIPPVADHTWQFVQDFIHADKDFSHTSVRLQQI